MTQRTPRRGSLRVTGGRFRSRRLRSPQGGIRPTSDRVREATFARLGDLEGTRVLDLYAGTGALGIEAISRGAARVAFVERSPRCLAALRANLAALGIEGEARVLAGDVGRALRRLARDGERFDLALLDPPYASGEVPRALAALVVSGVLVPGAAVVVESGRCHPVAAPDALTRLDERRYGDTCITCFAAADGPVAPAEAEGGGPDRS